MTTHTKIVGDDILNSLQILTKFVPQVALEMMSRAGNAVRVEQRRALKNSRRVYTVTREDLAGNKYLAFSPQPLEFGHRESKNQTANPESMANMINSYLMEASMTLVVNGSHPSFIPVIRRDGEIVGVGSRIKGVGKATHAILQRMNDDKRDSYYPTRDQLYKGKIGTYYAQRGISNARQKTTNYLVYAYGEALKRAEQKHNKKVDIEL